MRCSDCSKCDSIRDASSVEKTEVVYCREFLQYRACELERHCSEFEQINYHSGKVYSGGVAA